MKPRFFTILLLVLVSLECPGVENASKDHAAKNMKVRFTTQMPNIRDRKDGYSIEQKGWDDFAKTYGCVSMHRMDAGDLSFTAETYRFSFSDSVVDETLIRDFRSIFGSQIMFAVPDYKSYGYANDYLLCDSLNHHFNVMARLTDDQDFKRFWLANGAFNYRYTTPDSITSPWTLNVTTIPLLSYFRNSGYEDYPDTDYGLYPEGRTPNHMHIGTGYRFSGNLGLWHLTKEYNDVLDAWDYTKGRTKYDERIIVLIVDPTGFYQHPDFKDLTLPYLPLPKHIASHVGLSTHGTKCLGALAAGMNYKWPQNGFDVMSSVGVAPEIQVVAMKTLNDYPRVKQLLLEHGDFQRVKVLSCSTVDMSGDPHLAEMVQDGILPVLARGYGSTGSDYKDYVNRTDFVIVGDYLPNYQVKTMYQRKEQNFGTAFQTNISAPGFIWTTGFNPVETVFPDYVGQFAYETPTLDFGTNTSIAAPQVAGIAALVFAMYPWMTAAQVKTQLVAGGHHGDLLQASSAKLPELQDIPASQFGGGCVDAMGALYLHGSFEQPLIFEHELNQTTLLGTDFVLTNTTMEVKDGYLRIQRNAMPKILHSQMKLDDHVTMIMEEGACLMLDAGSSVILGKDVRFCDVNGNPLTKSDCMRNVSP